MVLAIALVFIPTAAVISVSTQNKAKVQCKLRTKTVGKVQEIQLQVITIQCTYMIVTSHMNDPFAILDIAADQAMVWQETTADDEDTVSDAHTGGVTPTNVDEKMMHNIQVLLPDTIKTLMLRQVPFVYRSWLVGWLLRLHS